ncbi:MAG TPA: LLM class flavin-dependent oxidoreductase [Mycobacterium sp.]|nr:LLM class flavin-dependent oxidoreductase [Mycobacterium sp.]
MLKVGVAEQLLNTRFSSTASARASYLAAVATGMDSFWVPDHINSLFPRAAMTPKYMGAARLIPDADAHLEPWTVLGNFAARNRLGRLRLGVGVTDTGRRNPAVTAQAAATLHLITRGRAILGIGAGEREGNEPYGVDWSKPVARFEEAMATIRALWNSGGELVTRDSPFFPLHNAMFALPPYRGKWPEIWIAAHGPRMLRAAGRYADAWFPAITIRPKDYAAGLEKVRAAASDAGRDPLSITAANWLFVVTGASRGEVDEALESTAMKAFALNLPADEWARHGATHPLGDDFSGNQDFVPQTIDEQAILSYTANVPPSLLKQGLLTGTPDEVIDQATEWRNQGMEYVVICNVSAVQPSMRRGLTATIPLMRILRKLRRL